MSLTGTVGIEIRINNEAREITPLLDEFVWTDSLLRGGFTWALKLKTNYWTEWWNLMLGREKPEVRFRLKQQEQGVESTTEWRRAYTDWSKAKFSAEPTMRCEVHGADKRLDLMQRSRLRAFKDAKVSDVVARVAGDHGLTVDAVITKGTRTRRQLREDDWSFLRRLTRAAATQDGRGDLFLYMDEGTLRLVSVQSQASSVRRHDTLSIENRLNDYVVQYHGRQVDRLGGATLRGVGFDYGAKAGIVFDVDAAAASAHQALSKRVPRRQADGLRSMPVIEDDQAVVEETTRSLWGDLGPRYFSLRVNTRPDVVLRPNAVIEIVAADDPNRQSVFQGRYLLLEVVHHYKAGTLSTTAVGFRREAWEGEDQPTGAVADNVRTRDRFRGDSAATQTAVIKVEELV